MAKLFELAGSESTRRMCAKMEVIARSSRAYEKRMGELCEEKNIFGTCKQTRPQKKWRNRVSTEQAGTRGSVIVLRRFPNSRLTCVCKSRAY